MKYIKKTTSAWKEKLERWIICIIGISRNTWRGSLWQLRFIEREVGMNNLDQIARIELTETGSIPDDVKYRH